MCASSSADRVAAYEAVGRRFESSLARHSLKGTVLTDCPFFIACAREDSRGDFELLM